ncbi:MAG: LuxR C-terminal-related transcriptional regulator [Gammaproteobacteria bacterium]
MAEGKACAPIAESLSLSSKSVSNDSLRIKQKLGAASVADLARLAIAEGLLPAHDASGGFGRPACARSNAGLTPGDTGATPLCGGLSTAGPPPPADSGSGKGAGPQSAVFPDASYASSRRLLGQGR